MTDRLQKVVGGTLGIPVESVSDDCSAGTIKAWDSVAHINLMLAIEVEFEVAFSPDEATEMLSVGAIRELLHARGVQEI
jgi:acyl carrier protein